MTIKRSGLIAFILTLIQPGLGHIYKGEIGKYFLFLCVSVFVLFGGVISGLFETPMGGLLIVLALLLGTIWVLFDASRSTSIPNLKWYNRWYIYFAFFLVPTVVLWPTVHFLRANYYGLFLVPSRASEPTILVGDRIVTSRLYYRNHSPSRGDLVIFHRSDDPSTTSDESSIQYIKRVIGLPGESLEVRGPQVYINGTPIAEPYAVWSAEGQIGGDFGPITIEADKFFMLGDNRDSSRDSRHWPEHQISRESIESKVMYIYFAPDSSRIGKTL